MKKLTPPEKAALVCAVEEAMENGLSLNKASQSLGVAPATFVDWRKRLSAADGDPFSAFAVAKPTGRPPAVDWSELDLNLARFHRLAKTSMEVAIWFYCRDPQADQAIVAKLRTIEERALESGKAPNWPMSVRRAFYVTDDEAARFRGKKAVNDSEMVTRRGMFWLDDDGHAHDILPGELWELDDYSGNQPFTYRDPQTGELLVGRQILAGMDSCGAGWLGFDMIGRPRDAYRGEDIVRFIGRLIRAHGMPRFLRLERGAWESSFIHGIAVEGLTQPWGALDPLFHIEHVFKSKGKGLLEGSFNPLQNWLAHAGRDVGRHAGEFESSTKAWRQVKNSKTAIDPRTVGFWSQEDCANAHHEAAQIMNGRPRERACFRERVSANDLQARLGWHTTPLPEAEAWRLLPTKQRRVIADGHVKVNPGGGWPEMSFVVNGQEGLHLENGHAVLVACDPADPTAGAYIANADRGARNRQAWGVGQMLLSCAPFDELSPQINLSGKVHGTINLRKQAAAAAATDFRAVMSGAPGKREVAVFDGEGRGATAGNLDPAVRPTARRTEAGARPAGREGLAPTRGGDDAAALFGTDRAARLREAQEAAKQQI